MALVCGIDVETTGLDVEACKIIEVGLVIWDTEVNQPKAMSNMLVKIGDAVPPEISKLTGITTDDLEDFGEEPQHAAQVTQSYLRSCNAVVAHNGALFDKPVLSNWFKRLELEMPAKPWIDTSCDIDYPPAVQTRKLTHLAAEHGFLNPFAHRALFDVLTMLQVFSRYDYNEVLALSLEPTLVVQALCSKPWEDNGKSTAEAKANGYRWDGNKKQWLKSVKQSRLQQELEKAQSYRAVELRGNA